MIFGNNYVNLEHKNGFKLRIDTLEALSEVDHSAILPKVAHSKGWIKSKESTLESPEIIKDAEPWDWTYSTYHKGKVTNGEKNVKIERTADKIDLERLKRPDPILFYDELILFEDELADNGISQLSIKLRVMPTCFFVLIRFWLRIDEVLFRLADTRIFHDISKDFILRDFQLKEGTFKGITMMLPDPSKYSDPNSVSPLLKHKENYVEKLFL